MNSGPAGSGKPKRRDIDEERRRLRDEFGVLDGGDDPSRIVVRYLNVAETADLAGPMPSPAGLLRLIAPSPHLTRLRLLLTLPPPREMPRPEKAKGIWKRIFGRHVEDVPDPTDALDHWVLSLPAPALTRLVHSLESRRLEIHVRAQAPADAPPGLMVLSAPETRDRTRVFQGAIVGATPPDGQRESHSAELLVFVDREEQVERLQHQFDDWWDDALPRRQDLLRFSREHLERITAQPVPGLPSIRLTMSPQPVAVGDKQEIRVAWAHVGSVKLERVIGEAGGWKTLVQQPGGMERKGTFRGRFPVHTPGQHYLRATGIDGTGRLWISPALVLGVEAPAVEPAGEQLTEAQSESAPAPVPPSPTEPSSEPAGVTSPVRPSRTTGAAEVNDPKAVSRQAGDGEREAKSHAGTEANTAGQPKPEANGSRSAEPSNSPGREKDAPSKNRGAASGPGEAREEVPGASDSQRKDVGPLEADEASGASRARAETSAIPVDEEEGSKQPIADAKNPSPRIFYELVLHEVFSRPMSTGMSVPTNRIKNLSGADDAISLIEDLATPKGGNVRLEDVLRVQYVELKREEAYLDRMSACLRAVPLVVELRSEDVPFDLLLVRRNREPLLLPWDRETNQILDGEDLSTLTILEQARANRKPSGLAKLPYSLGVVIRKVRERYESERVRPRQLPRAMAKALTRLDMIALSTEDASLQIHSDALRTQLATVPPPVLGVERLESLVRDGAKMPNKEFVQLVEDFLTDLEDRLRKTESRNEPRPQKVRVDLLAALVRHSDAG